MSFPYWPSYSREEAEAASRVLLSNKVNYWTGNEGRAFEKEFAGYCGCRYAVALCNGTAALELALRALGIGMGDEVIVPCYTFIATASAVVACGAVPVMADVDRDSLTITAETVAPRITSRTKAVIPVHLMGYPCDMDPILMLSEKHGLKVVEDCAQAHGARYKGRSVGTIGDIGAWSFCQDKIMTTAGEGGMVTTDNEVYREKMWSYKDHGKSWKAVYGKKHSPGFRWVHESFGTNWRMTEIQAAIGRIQLSRMPVWQAQRKRNASILSDGFRSIPGIEVQEQNPDIVHAYYKYAAFLETDILRFSGGREAVMEAVNASGVPCFSGVCPEIYREKAFEQANLVPPERMPAAHEMGKRSLVFQVHPALQEQHMYRTVEVVRQVLSQLQ